MSAARVQDINVRQNDDQSLDLLFAAHVAHRHARVYENWRTAIVLLLAAGAIFAVRVEGVAAPLAIAGVLLTVASEVSNSLISRRWTQKAMLLQEAFDTRLFDMEWNGQLGTRPLGEEVHSLAAKFAGSRDKKRDWYVDVSGLPLVCAVLICQRENVVWDFRLRRQWAGVVFGATIGWVALGTVIALVADWSVRDLFLRWLAPSLPAVVLGVEKAYANVTTAAGKETLARELDATVQGLRPGEPSASEHARLAVMGRRMQDTIAHLRDRDPGVPQRLYWKRRDRDEAGARASADQLTSALRSGTGS